MFAKTKKKVYLLLDPDKDASAAHHLINDFIIALILLSTLSVVLETVEKIYEPYKTVFKLVEVFSIIIFSIEYLCRVWSCTCNEKYAHPFWGRLKFIFSLGGLIDLLAIMPFYIPLFGNFDFRFIRLLRLLRLTRFFKLGKYMHAKGVIFNAVRSKKEELVFSFIITISLIFVASCLMYFIEHQAQPGKFSSIPETMSIIVTFITVGYGDTYPLTVMGKILMDCISLLGIALFALPAGILASGFIAEFKKFKNQKNICPHCGQEIE
ncbi:MAG: ion transporter [Bacteroidetes bacterium]|nr:ion transporter [Bacteroidota bacterium]